MTGADVFFTLVHPNEPEPQGDNFEGRCTCSPVDGPWKLMIDEGSVVLTHSVCGNSLPYDDLMDTVYMEETEVLLSMEKSTCHCLGGCDCDWSIVLSLPR